MSQSNIFGLVLLITALVCVQAQAEWDCRTVANVETICSSPEPITPSAHLYARTTVYHPGHERSSCAALSIAAGQQNWVEFQQQEPGVFVANPYWAVQGMFLHARIKCLTQTAETIKWEFEYP